VVLPSPSWRDLCLALGWYVGAHSDVSTSRTEQIAHERNKALVPGREILRRVALMPVALGSRMNAIKRWFQGAKSCTVLRSCGAGVGPA
jgi:hypothetical protein